MYISILYIHKHTQTHVIVRFFTGKPQTYERCYFSTPSVEHSKGLYRGEPNSHRVLLWLPRLSLHLPGDKKNYLIDLNVAMLGGFTLSECRLRALGGFIVDLSVPRMR